MADSILELIGEVFQKMPKQEQESFYQELLWLFLMDSSIRKGEASTEEQERFEALTKVFTDKARVIKMTTKQAEEYIKGLLGRIDKASYEKAHPNVGSYDERRSHFTGYVTGTLHALLKLSERLGEIRQVKDKDLQKWVQEYVNEMYPYSRTTQGLLPNQLRQTGKKTKLREGNTLIFNGEKVKLAFFESDKYGGAAMTVPMQKVNAMFQEALCKRLPTNLKQLSRITLEELDKYSNITITLDDYMGLTGVKDKKEARAVIKDACDRLYHVSYIVETEGKTYKGRLFSAQVVSSYGGKFEMKFTPDYLRYCATIRPADFHRGLYRIRGKYNPYSWGLGHKLWSYYIINRGKARANRLSVKSLTEAVPDLPTYEEVISEGKHISQRIIEPFERDMDELKRVGFLLSWEYCNGRGTPLTNEQLENMDYSVWIKLYISFTLNLPSQDSYIENHKKKLAAAKRKTTRKKKA